MKKILTILVTLLLSLSSYGQHLKFMGIPIDGSISAFETQLSAKGITSDESLSKDSEGIKHFKGEFTGTEAYFFVYYNKHSNIVYRVKVSIPISQGLEYQYLNEYKKKINRKYPNAYTQELSHSGYDSYNFLISRNKNNRKYKYSMGYIALYISTPTFDDIYLSLEYNDRVNTDKYEAQNEENL